MKFKKIHEKIFAIWTFVSIIGMIVAGFFNAKVPIMIFGQYFLIMGLVILFSKHLIYISLHLITIGLACLLIPFLQMFPEINNAVNWNIIIVMVTIYQFIHVAGTMIISQIKKLYKEPVINKNSFLALTIGILFLTTAICLIIYIFFFMI